MVASIYASMHPALQAALIDRLMWNDLRSIQTLAWPEIVAGNNALLIAATAGGKTEAAALPLLEQILSDSATPRAGVQIVWFAPLRALVENLADRLEPICRAVGLRAVAWHGDTLEAERDAALDEPPTILVTTPESAESMFVSRRDDRRWVDWLGARQATRAIIFDEVHALCGTARGAQLLSIARRLPAGVQRIGLSATVGRPEQVLDWMCDNSPRPRRLVVTPPSPRRRRSGVVCVSADGLVDELVRLCAGLRVLIFAPTRARVEQLASTLAMRGVDCRPHHAGLDRETRALAEQMFVSSPTTEHGVALVCTSTLELGVDLPNVDRVVQVGPPPSVNSLVQRMGRSGRRAGRIAELAIVVESARDEQSARHLLERARAGDHDPPVFDDRNPRFLEQQILCRVAAADEHEPVVVNALLDELATLRGLCHFSRDELDAELREQVARGRVRESAGELWVGDRPAPWWRVLTVFERGPEG